MTPADACALLASGGLMSFGQAVFFMPADTHRRRGVRTLVLLFSALLTLAAASGALVFHLLKLGH